MQSQHIVNRLYLTTTYSSSLGRTLNAIWCAQEATIAIFIQFSHINCEIIVNCSDHHYQSLLLISGQYFWRVNKKTIDRELEIRAIESVKCYKSGKSSLSFHSLLLSLFWRISLIFLDNGINFRKHSMGRDYTFHNIIAI